jgi:hypothetical protein
MTMNTTPLQFVDVARKTQILLRIKKSNLSVQRKKEGYIENPREVHYCSFSGQFLIIGF